MEEGCMPLDIKQLLGPFMNGLSVFLHNFAVTIGTPVDKYFMTSDVICRLRVVG